MDTKKFAMFVFAPQCKNTIVHVEATTFPNGPLLLLISDEIENHNFGDKIQHKK
jgi:hypothetical protein